jgi:Flavin reductase like domain
MKRRGRGARRAISHLAIIAHDRSMRSGDVFMRQLKLSKVFTFIEPGPVVLVTTSDGSKNNVMTISWTMVVDFTPVFAITTGAWNHSFAALQRTGECVTCWTGWSVSPLKLKPQPSQSLQSQKLQPVPKHLTTDRQ